MPSYLLGLCAVAVTAYSIRLYWRLSRRIEEIKATGLPYVVSPIFVWSILNLFTHRLWLPWLQQLPSWIQLRMPWLRFIKTDYVWSNLYDPFRDFGSDAYFIVTPGSVTLVVADPSAISQITSRRNDFPKPTEFYGGINIYGPNVVSAEGSLWRHHRKVTSPQFNEKNNELVWQESLRQAETMMDGWTQDNGDDTGRLKDVADQTMRLALYVISRAGFGVGLKWPHEQDGEETIPEGHSMSYKTALSTLLHNNLSLMFLPHWILRRSTKKLRLALDSYFEWGSYMRELYDQKRDEVQSDHEGEGIDLMGALVRGAGGYGKDEKHREAQLSEEAVFGNAFVFILAGHETSANTLHFAMLYLAMHSDSQKHLQDDLDSILGDRPASEWTYDSDMPKLFGSMCGAVMNEELRLLAPVPGIFKSTAPGKPQILNIANKQVNVPGGCMIILDTAAVHRHPKYWPHTTEEDLLEFRPERWLLDPNAQQPNTDDDVYAKEEGLEFDQTDKRPDTAASLYRPGKATYIPFSEGYRSCLGRRFAQVEILAVLATIFKTWTVELDVSDYLPDEKFATASEQEKKQAWSKADDHARYLLREGMVTMITLQMRKGTVPLRFVKRGSERF